MSTRPGKFERAAGLVCSADSKVGEAPARRYASFVVRGWRPGAAGTLEIAHDQSGERVRADSLIEAIGWIQARSVPSTAPIELARGR